MSAAFIVWVGLTPASAEKRVALVIGNSNYSDVPVLQNPRNDAEDVSAALKRLGFKTMVSLDADRNGMEKAVEDFAAEVEDADVALFYYAGHAMQHQGVNYLMPIDANLQSASGLRRLTKLNDIVADVKRAKALRIMIIDACRDNPMAERLETAAAATQTASRATRSAGLARLTRSLAKSDVGQSDVARGGDIIVYAAEAGRTAADGAGRNSPFSGAFIRYVETEGQEVVALMRRITTSVQDETKGEQRPELSLAVPFEFYFRPGPPQPPPTVQQLVPNAKPFEIGAIESRVEQIVAAQPEAERAQARREAMALLSDLATRSGLRADQIVAELPKAHARLLQTRTQIAEFRQLMETEPGIAPFIEIAAAAVSTGRKPDLQAADQALAQAQARYDDAVFMRTQQLERTRSNRAALSEQRANIAETEFRNKDAAEFFIAAAKDTPESDVRTAARRYAMAGTNYFIYGENFFANDALRETIRVMENEALPRFARFTPADDWEKKENGKHRALAMASVADAQTKLGGRTPGIEGARMIVNARATYSKALQEIDFETFPGIVMDILDRRAARDMEFGRRFPRGRGKENFNAAISARRTILEIQAKYPAYKDDLGRARNNLAYALHEASRRTEGEEGDKQIDEAIELLQGAIETLDRLPFLTHKLIARANLAQAYGSRAARKPNDVAKPDMERAIELFDKVDLELDKNKEPRVWAIVKQFEGEFYRMLGERLTDPDEKFKALKRSFETFQLTLSVLTKEAAPNDWAMVCAEMGYTIVAVLPFLGPVDKQRFARNAVLLFNNAQAYFQPGGFMYDLDKVKTARATAEASLPAEQPKAAPAPADASAK
jgi:uncharacterized caspase-like protein